MKTSGEGDGDAAMTPVAFASVAVPAAQDELLLDAQRGDDAALDQLVRREWPSVFAIVAAGTRNRFEAEEVTQEVFARVLSHLSGFQPGRAPFEAYVATVARNLLRDRWRQHKSRPAFDIEMSELADDEPGPEAQALVAFDRHAVVAALGRLPADYRTVLRLRMLEHRSTDEIAGLLGRQRDAIRQLQHRALDRLRREYLGEAEWGER